MNYTVIIVPTTTEQDQELLVASLMEYPVRAFQQEPDRLLIFPEQGDLMEQSVLQLLAEKKVVFQIEQVEAVNWNANWEQQLEPVLMTTASPVYKQVSIRASFHPTHPMADLEVVITPRMSFGTGHHATTQLMVEQLAQLSVQGKRVLDIGTGTGVLAILAQKMGASVICATESEHWGYENARANFIENNCASIQLVQTDRLPVFFPSFDVIIANINKNTILQLLPQLKEKAHADTILLLSGWLTSDNLDMIAGLAIQGVTPVTTVVKGDWCAMQCQLALG